MLICYTLSMPNCASWDGRWSGEGVLYARAKSYTSKSARKNASDILQKGSFCYRWSDGWSASVNVKMVTSEEARKIRKKSRGFCGYDWMINEIEEHARIRPENERH